VISPSKNLTNIAATALLIAAVGGCANKNAWRDPGFAYEPNAFRSTIQGLTSSFSNNQVVVPFEVPRHAIKLARRNMRSSPSGLNPVDVLVSTITSGMPKGLGLEYDWSASVTANQAIELRRGDCVALAMVLVGIGRSLDWPIYFAEARPLNPVKRELDGLNVLSSHMVVIVLTQSGPVTVDFLGLVEKSEYKIHPIDDISAYAHLLNNITAHRIAHDGSQDREAWRTAQQEFEYITRLRPDFAHAWNNLGIVLTRLDQYEKARLAYNKSSDLDPSFGSSSRNLTIMETRAVGKTTVSVGTQNIVR